MDRRDSKTQWYDSFDEQRMVIVLEEEETPDGKHPSFPDGCKEGSKCSRCGTRWEEADQQTCSIDMEIPAVFDVCGTCEGRGSHVNPSIDSNGLTASDFDEAGPEFREDYFSGVYDVPCNECHGKRVVPWVDEQRATEEQMKAVNERLDALYRENMERAAEIRFGY